MHLTHAHSFHCCKAECGDKSSDLNAMRAMSPVSVREFFFFFLRALTIPSKIALVKQVHAPGLLLLYYMTFQTSKMIIIMGFLCVCVCHKTISSISAAVDWRQRQTRAAISGHAILSRVEGQRETSSYERLLLCC